MTESKKDMPRIAVYAIAKNEETFVDRWVNSMKEADEIVVLDTGSTDRTVEKLRAYGVKTEVGVFKPWRFDNPRNASLQLVSQDVDICICTDLDEVLTPGWAKTLRETWVFNGGKLNGVGANLRVRYLYTWNFNPDGSPGTTFWYEKCHPRNGYRWVKPVHEILNCYLPEGETEAWVNCPGFQLHHHADPTKSRASYLPLLKMSVAEEPEDDRNSHYYGRELMYYGQWDQAINELVRHLNLPRAKWYAERAASMRFISSCFQAKQNKVNALEWALKACAEDPNARETWIQLARVLCEADDWHGTLFAVERALAILERPTHYINEPESWSALPYAMGAQAKCALGLFEDAKLLVEKGLSIDPMHPGLRGLLLHLTTRG